ncbi:tetratricopeptide repeat protein [Christiangramia aquimixticola]|uniref:tetratricopeptide repeat protein n=1 Tax=Christiangramia aquimixticola TaxID=1697558 RepID=UPI003AA9121F
MITKTCNKYVRAIATAIFIIGGLGNVIAQEKSKKAAEESNAYVAEAQEELADNNFAAAEAAYRKAIAKDPANMVAKYNMGNLYYEKEKTLSAKQRLDEAAELAETKAEKHRIYHNLGNSHMQQKNYQEAVNAFKDALRNDPTDEETRYNLALAKKMLEKEKQQQDQNKDQNKQDEKDKKDQKDQQKDKQNEGEGGDDQNEDQKPKDEGENEKDKKDGDQNEDKDKEQGDEKKEDKGKGEQDKEQKQKPVPGRLSPQQIQNLLEAMNNEEKKVQDKINAEKAKGVKTKSEKDW